MQTTSSVSARKREGDGKFEKRTQKYIARSATLVPKLIHFATLRERALLQLAASAVGWSTSCDDSDQSFAQLAMQISSSSNWLFEKVMATFLLQKWALTSEKDKVHALRWLVSKQQLSELRLADDDPLGLPDDLPLFLYALPEALATHIIV